MELHKIESRLWPENPGSAQLTNHENSVAVEGLEDLFQWASDMMTDGEDGRVKRAREHRIRRQVLEVVQKLREQQAVVRATTELAYLQRRLIALLQKLQEVTEENAVIKQVMVAQAYSLEAIPRLEAEIRHLREIEYERQQAELEKKELLNALSKLKVDRDFLDDLLRAMEEENTRLAGLLADCQTELEKLKARRWWHILWPKS